MSRPDLDDHALAHHLATRAGELLVSVRAALVADGASAAELGAEGDRRAHELLMERLGSDRPRDEVLSEEGAADESPERRAARARAHRVWIVDPLDGTREFSEPPRTDWAVHVALCVDGVPTAGAVALPGVSTTFSTLDPPRPPSAAGRPRRVVVSRTRPPAEALRIATALDAELVEMGSAGAKAMAVVRGEVDLYPHSGGQYEWDSCAPVAVAAGAGLWCSRLDGSPLRYNRPDPLLPDLLIGRPELAEAAIAAAR